MSAAAAGKRIRASRVAHRFPCILEMIRAGELHLSGVNQLAGHLTDDNYRYVLRRARHRSMREIDDLIAEISPRPDVAWSVRALPQGRDRVEGQALSGEAASATATVLDSEVARNENGLSRGGNGASAADRVGRGAERGAERGVPTPGAPQAGAAGRTSRSKINGKPNGSTTSLSPRRYRLQVTIGQEARDALQELRGLLSHQIPDGDPATIVERALEALLTETKKKKAALTTKPRAKQKTGGLGRSGRQKSCGIGRFRRKFGGKCSNAMEGGAHSRTPKGGDAIRPGSSSFTTACRTRERDRTAWPTSSFGAGHTISSRPSATMGEP